MNGSDHHPRVATALSMISIFGRHGFSTAALCIGALACWLAVAAQLGAEERPTVSFQEIEESLTCQCGCGLTVHSCNHLQCPSALPLRAEIREQMKLNMGKPEILTYFGEKYGEKILSAPTAEGFNLLAWVTPFLLMGIGGVFVVVTVRHWSNRRAPTVAPQASATKLASVYDKLLEKELKDFDA